MTAVDFEGSNFARTSRAERVKVEAKPASPKLTLEYVMISLGSALLTLALILGFTGH